MGQGWDMDKRLSKAMAVALRAHKGLVDRTGKPQIWHSYRVMDRVDELDEKIVAVLHDVVEDTPTTLEDLKNFGFNSEIVDAVDAISRRKEEKYFDYINRLSENCLATKVKIADLNDNLNREHPSPKEYDSLKERYNKALRILTTIEDKYWHCG